MRPRGRVALLAAFGALALGAVGCGAEDHPNEPRVPAPVTITIEISDDEVTVSPDGIGEGTIDELGAGLAEVVIANLTGLERTVTIEGPVSVTSNPIVANGTGEVKVDLEQGEYEVSAGEGPAPAKLVVGEPRPSAHNEVLLP